MNYMARSNYQEEFRERRKAPVLTKEPQLTEQELLIVNMLKEGRKQLDISNELLVSVSWVNGKIMKMCKEYECSNSTQLVYKLAKEGVI